jgi:hypothetical protein
MLFSDQCHCTFTLSKSSRQLGEPEIRVGGSDQAMEQMLEK